MNFGGIIGRGQREYKILRLSFIQYRLRPPHSPLPAVPLLRWRRLEGWTITANYSAKMIWRLNFAYQIGIFY